MKDVMAKLDEVIHLLKIQEGKARLPDSETSTNTGTPEQSYDAPVDEGNEMKKKMFVAAMKKQVK